MVRHLLSWFLLLALLVLALALLVGWLASPVPVHSSTGHDVRLPGDRPSLSVAFLDRVLASAHSPAAGKGSSLFTLSQQYGIDDAYALAFFRHESSYGTAGEARVSRSLGNLRCLAGVACRDGYAWFPTWEAGFRAWYVLLSGPLYVGSGLLTVEQIIPRYAPSADQNNEAAYITTVNEVVASWRSGSREVSP